MIKYQFSKNVVPTDYWSYCNFHQIPYIVISPIGLRYANISYDLLPCIPLQDLSGNVSTKLIPLYEGYFDFFKIPKKHFCYAGGSIAMGFTIRREHAEFIANHLFDYLSAYVAKNIKSLGT